MNTMPPPETVADMPAFDRVTVERVRSDRPHFWAVSVRRPGLKPGTVERYTLEVTRDELVAIFAHVCRKITRGGLAQDVHDEAT